MLCMLTDGLIPSVYLDLDAIVQKISSVNSGKISNNFKLSRYLRKNSQPFAPNFKFNSETFLPNVECYCFFYKHTSDVCCLS